MLGIEEETDLPPCKVEIVLGASGRLYVVLPTGVETKLPFACNAPFIQDPARLKIKDPEISPTNRWLLQRAGKLAASSMLHWLGKTEMSMVDRARAYGLFLDVDTGDQLDRGGLWNDRQRGIWRGNRSATFAANRRRDSLRIEKESIAIPMPVFDVWPAEQAAVLLDEKGRMALSRHIEPANVKKLCGGVSSKKSTSKNSLSHSRVSIFRSQRPGAGS